MTISRRPLPDLRGASTAEVAQALVDARRVPGISFATIVEGDVSSSGALGSADLRTGIALGPDTVLEGASLTKPVVAALAMRLIDHGGIDLDESVASTVEAPRIVDRSTYAFVTPRHLLSHTSGLPNWSGDPRRLDRRSKLRFESRPGERFRYSGEGYGILAELVEHRSGTSLRTLSGAFFDELGMSSSTLVGTTHSGSLARGHWGRSPSREARRFDRPIAAMSMLTHAADYARLLCWHLDPSMVSAPTRTEFLRRHASVQRGDDADVPGWALGWGVVERPSGAVHFQWGDNGPFRAVAAFSATLFAGVVYLVNGSTGLRYADLLVRPVLGDLTTATGWFTRPSLEPIRRVVRL